MTGYDEAHHANLAELEPGNWWFRSRNALILQALTTYFPHARSMLEVGCGTGFVMSGIATAMPGLELVGTELLDSGLEQARRRLPSVRLMQMDAREMPFHEEFSVAGAFDVIEHIDDDHAVVAGMYQAVVPGGGLILTVPQHPRMWSLADEQAHHERRYTRKSLFDVVESAGFEVLWSTSFVSLLSPLMVASRLSGDGRRREDPYVDFRISPTLNATFERIGTWERRMIRSGVRFPVGGSRILVARKPR